MALKPMKTLTIGDKQYEIIDAVAREKAIELQNSINNTLPSLQNQLNEHNSNTNAHADIRDSISSLSSSKVNTSDVVANLTTNSNSKVLAASQGAALKSQIDGLNNELDNHNHDTLYYTKSQIDNQILITTDEIDAICDIQGSGSGGNESGSANIPSAKGVEF